MDLGIVQSNKWLSITTQYIPANHAVEELGYRCIGYSQYPPNPVLAYIHYHFSQCFTKNPWMVFWGDLDKRLAIDIVHHWCNECESLERMGKLLTDAYHPLITTSELL
jgi:hypothetical protein